MSSEADVSTILSSNIEADKNKDDGVASTDRTKTKEPLTTTDVQTKKIRSHKVITSTTERTVLDKTKAGASSLGRNLFGERQSSTTLSPERKRPVGVNPHRIIRRLTSPPELSHRHSLGERRTRERICEKQEKDKPISSKEPMTSSESTNQHASPVTAAEDAHDSVEVKAQASQVVIESEEVKAQASQVVIESEEVKAQASQVVIESEEVKAQASQVVIESEEVKAQASQVVIESEEVKAQASQVVIESEEVKAQASQVVIESEINALTPKRRSQRFYSVCDSEHSYHPPPTKDTFELMREGGREVVAVIGSGDYGVALGKMLERAGYHVLIVTRSVQFTRTRLTAMGTPIAARAPPLPNAQDKLTGVESADQPMTSTEQPANGVLELTSYEAGLPRASMVFISMDSRHFCTLPHQLLAGKVLVDVSNKESSSRPGWVSNAEYLQRLAPDATVVKSLNTVPLWVLKKGVATKNPTCSDHPWAMEAVTDVLWTVGLPSQRCGGLAEARGLEKRSLRFFPQCSLALPLAIAVVTFYALLTLFRDQLCDMIFSPHWTEASFDTFLLSNTLMVCGLSVLTLLTLVYLPGVLAAYLQLYRGTKYFAFPEFLNVWLQQRTHIGLAALLLVCLHALCVLLYNSQQSLHSSADTETWIGPTVMGLGAIGLLLLSVQGVCSLPTVTAELSWSESQFIFSRVGWFAFLVATTHVFMRAWHSLWQANLKCHVLPQGTQLALLPALLTITAKMPLLLPCVDRALSRIRRGHSRAARQEV